MNNNEGLGCIGWIIVLVALAFAIEYWYVSVTIIAIIVAIWWYQNKSPHAKEIQEQKKAEEYQAEQARQKQLKEYVHDDLTSLALKDDVINLKPTEYIYYCEPDSMVDWQEVRQRTKRVNYGGLSGNIRIMKGLHYRTGSIRTDIQKEQYVENVFEGHPILTNRRVVLYNPNTQIAKAYPFTRILRATAYSDGTVLSSDAGKTVTLTGFTNPDKFNVYLQRLMSEGNEVIPK